jgi:NADP-dependent aldehyde dehydrogenase
MLSKRAGRLVINGFPTGVEVCPSIVHGGPYPATSDGRTTSVGTRAITRFSRLVAWQDCPENLLPVDLQSANLSGIWRIVDGKFSKKALSS